MCVCVCVPPSCFLSCDLNSESEYIKVWTYGSLCRGQYWGSSDSHICLWKCNIMRFVLQGTFHHQFPPCIFFSFHRWIPLLLVASVIYITADIVNLFMTTLHLCVLTNALVPLLACNYWLHVPLYDHMLHLKTWIMFWLLTPFCFSTSISQSLGWAGIYSFYNIHPELWPSWEQMLCWNVLPQDTRLQASSGGEGKSWSRAGVFEWV